MMTGLRLATLRLATLRLATQRSALAGAQTECMARRYKDLPIEADPRIVIAAVPEWADPRDALVARDGIVLGELPAGAVLGTGSPRRAGNCGAERALLAAVGEGGDVAVGALADVVEDLDDEGRVVLPLFLRGGAATADDDLVRSSATAPYVAGELTDVENLGRQPGCGRVAGSSWRRAGWADPALRDQVRLNGKRVGK